MISTLHDEAVEKVQTMKGGEEKPSYVVEYNTKIDGVDLTKQKKKWEKSQGTGVKNVIQTCSARCFEIYHTSG